MIKYPSIHWSVGRSQEHAIVDHDIVFHVRDRGRIEFSRTIFTIYKIIIFLVFKLIFELIRAKILMRFGLLLALCLRYAFVQEFHLSQLLQLLIIKVPNHGFFAFEVIFSFLYGFSSIFDFLCLFVQFLFFMFQLCILISHFSFIYSELYFWIFDQIFYGWAVFRVGI